MDSLLNIGLEYSQIAIILNELIECKLLKNTEQDGLLLTDLGNDVLKEGQLKLFSNSSSEWIVPLNKYKIEKMKFSDVYLPLKKG